MNIHEGFSVLQAMREWGLIIINELLLELSNIENTLKHT